LHVPSCDEDVVQTCNKIEALVIINEISRKYFDGITGGYAEAKTVFIYCDEYLGHHVPITTDGHRINYVYSMINGNVKVWSAAEWKDSVDRALMAIYKAIK